MSNTPDATAHYLLEQGRAYPDAFPQAFVNIAATLGGDPDWREPSELLEAIAKIVDDTLKATTAAPAVGSSSPDDFQYWESVGADLGLL